MTSHWALVVLLVQLVRCDENDVNFSSIPTPVSTPSWGYKCIPDLGCQRSEVPTDRGNTSLYPSVELCRTVCGRFGGLWPRPVTAALSAQTVPIHPNYLRQSIINAIAYVVCQLSNNEACRGTRGYLQQDAFRFDLVDVPAEARAILVEMSHVVTSNLLAECGGNVTELVETPVMVYTSVKSPTTSLTWDTDEEYTLDVQVKDGAVAVHIFAETIYGARHALETLTQLVAPDKPDFSNQHTCGLRLVSGAKIRDKPVYKHRGLTLDTSRNFMPLTAIRRTLDGMAATKMNVFHWHVTDSHSFPLESKSVPQFTRYGAYSESEIYTTEEVKELVRYAQVRGIRVVIEIDAPAHAGNGWQWGKEYGLGDLAVCVNNKNWRQFCIQPPCGQLNPANPNMYRVLKSLYKDIADLLPQPALLHMGGDEVFFNCWNSSEEISAYMKNKGFETNMEGYMRLWAEFHAQALLSWDDELKDLGIPPQPVMLWSSELTAAHRVQRFLDKDRYVIQVWEPVESPLLIQLLRLGYRVVSVPKNVWYLDHGFWGVTKYANWRRMYSHALPSEAGVLGGQVAMWSEYVDENDLDTRVWPRAAAVAERLWADPTSVAAAAEPRLQRLRARLVARGLRADALSPAWCAQHDARCLYVPNVSRLRTWMLQNGRFPDDSGNWCLTLMGKTAC